MHFCPPNARKWIKKLLQQKEEEMRPGGREGCFFQTSAKHSWRTERRPRFCWLFLCWNSKGVSKANDQTNWRGHIHDKYCWRTFKLKKTEWHQPKIVRTTIHTGGAELAGGRVPTLSMATRCPQGMESLHHQAWWLEDQTQQVMNQYRRNPGDLAEEEMHSISNLKLKLKKLNIC